MVTETRKRPEPSRWHLTFGRDAWCGCLHGTHCLVSL